jgi:RNA polymerase sigma-70 factor (ECF subfamily)
MPPLIPCRPATAESPALLVERAVAGERAAFEALVRQFQRPVFGFLGRMGLAQAEAEDIAQEAFVRAWQHLDRYRPEQAAFSTWLFTIARRLALNAASRAEHRLADRSGDPPPDQACEQPGPAQALDARQQRDAVHAALCRLPAADRCVLALAYVNDLSLVDISRIEACSEAAVKARLHRARHRLREVWNELNPDERK